MELQFRNIVGQRGSITLLQRSIARGNLGKITILEGVHGAGKTTTAFIAALSENCEHRINGEPCLKCKSCLSILDAIQHGGSTYNFNLVNIPEHNSGTKFSDLMNEIFVLQNTGTMVYVLEEAHSLHDKDLQTALLEQIDKMPNNIHLIMTTTEISDLIQPLRSRARIYHFSRLRQNESQLLLNRVCNAKGKKLSRETMKLIINLSRGIPRDIISLVEFILDNNVSHDELIDYLNVISNDDFIQLFTLLKTNTLSDLLDKLDELLGSNNMDTFVSQLKEFYLNCVYLVEGGIDDFFTDVQAETILATLDHKSIFSIASLVEKLSKFSTSADIRFCFLKIRQLLQDSNLNKSIATPTTALSRQVQATKDITKDTEFVNSSSLNKQQEVTRSDFLELLNTFGGK